MTGLTLFEILVALFILSILAAVSIPGLKTFGDGARDDILRRQLLRVITFAQHESQIRRKPIVLCNSNHQQRCGGNWLDGQLVFVNDQADGIVRSSDEVLAVRQVLSPHGSLHWRSFPRHRQYLLFSLSDVMRSDNGTFWHCHGKFIRWAIMISHAGRPRSVYPDKQGVIKDSQGKPLVCG